MPTLKKADASIDVPDRFLDAKSVGAILAISTKTVRRWREMGKLPPAINMHGRIRWKFSDIQAFMNSFSDSR